MARFLIFSLLVLAFFTGAPTPAASRDVFPYPYLPMRHIPVTSQFVRHPILPGPVHYLNDGPPGTNCAIGDRPNNQFSCKRRCGLEPRPSWQCQCHAACQDLNNCCDDFEALCYTCTGRCKAFIKHALCQCNKKCVQFKNCCSDYEQKCPRPKVTRPGLSKNWFGTLTKRAADDNSCVGRCGVLDTTKPCQCNDSCESFGDCCDDYEAVCNGLSCSGKCNADYDPADPCHCNDLCDQYNNCCPDYYDLCDGNSGVSDAALAAISEELLAMDNDNNIASFVSVNLQAKSRQDGSDPAPQPLMTVDPAAYDKPTVAKLIKMHDNFVPEVGVSEEISAAEQTEVNEFLDALLSTPIMIRTAEFLAETGYIPNNFRETFELIWFGLYSRSSGKLGSSGFEHVFLGELKSGVSGFHHWAYWAREEANGNLNYKGYIEQQNFGSKGMALSESFEWLNEDKSISSMFIGPSPELEMAIYTICFYARRNAQCPIVFNGQAVDVQTYDITYNGQQYVATAYAV